MKIVVADVSFSIYVLCALKMPPAMKDEHLQLHFLHGTNPKTSSTATSDVKSSYTLYLGILGLAMLSLFLPETVLAFFSSVCVSLVLARRVL